MFDAGSLFLRMEARDAQLINSLDKIENELKQTDKQVDELEKNTKSSFAAMGRAAALFGVALSKAWDMATFGLSSLLSGLKTFAMSSIGMASDAGEIGSKFDTVFGDQAGRAKDALEDFGKTVGRGRNELRQMASGIQDTFVPLGFSRDKAADLSLAMTKLAVDLGSFNNEADTEVMEGLKSALIGNHETVRKYGVIITEATLNQQLMNMGIKGGTEAASEQQKALARLQMIYAGTTDAQGDATTTADSFANQTKALYAAMADLGGELGSFMIPTLKVFVGATKEAINWIAANSTGLQEWGVMFGEWAATGISAVQEVINVIMNMDLYWKGTQIAIAEAMMTAYDRVLWFADNAWIAIEFFFTNFMDIATNTASNFIQIWENVVKNFGKIWEAIWKMIKTGGKQGFNEMLTAVAADLKTFDKRPEFQAFKGTDFSDDWKAHEAEWAKRLDSMAGKAGETAEKTKKGLDLQAMFNEVGGGGKAKDAVKASIGGAEEMFKKNVLSTFEKNDKDKQAKIAEATKVAAEKLVVNNEKNHKELVEAIKGTQGVTE